MDFKREEYSSLRAELLEEQSTEASLRGLFFLFRSKFNYFFLIVEFILFIVGILLHMSLDYIQSRRNIKNLFIEEFEKLNNRKKK